MFTKHNDLINSISKTSPFESERQLIDIVVKEIHHIVNGDVFTSTELPVGAGIVDVIAGCIKHIPQDSIARQALTGSEAYVLSHLYYRKRLKVETIVSRTELPRNLVENLLTILCRKGFCKTTGKCYLRTEPLLGNLVAIEGKIKDWKGALQQAVRNQLFSSQSFIAIDARHSRPALKNLMLFKKHHVGLILVFRSGFIRIVYRPPHLEPLASVMPILAEAALLERMSSLEC